MTNTTDFEKDPLYLKMKEIVVCHFGKTPSSDDGILRLWALLLQAKEETAKAFGGCENCYGKGYRTKIEYVTAHPDFYGQEEVKEQSEYYEPCSYCERGKQIKELIEKTRTKAKEEERENCIRVIRNIKNMSNDESSNQWFDALHCVISSLEALSTLNKEE